MSTIYNKVTWNGQTLIDISDTTAVEADVANGVVFYKADGSRSIGTSSLEYDVIDPIEFDYLPGYTDNGKWTYQNSTNNRTDIYAITANKVYILSLGSTVGARFRSGYAATNPATLSSGSINGTVVTQINNPSQYTWGIFKPTLTGYLYVTKDNASTPNLKTWLIDVTSSIDAIRNDVVGGT